MNENRNNRAGLVVAFLAGIIIALVVVFALYNRTLCYEVTFVKK